MTMFKGPTKNRAERLITELVPHMDGQAQLRSAITVVHDYMVHGNEDPEISHVHTVTLRWKSGKKVIDVDIEQTGEISAVMIDMAGGFIGDNERRPQQIKDWLRDLAVEGTEPCDS
mgnify:CR=1 FL=1